MRSSLSRSAIVVVTSLAEHGSLLGLAPTRFCFERDATRVPGTARVLHIVRSGATSSSHGVVEHVDGDVRVSGIALS